MASEKPPLTESAGGAGKERWKTHALRELGLVIAPEGDELRGTATVLPTMHVPTTDVLRLSILAAWGDTLLGLLSVKVLAPRVPVTLELDVHLSEPIRETDTVTMTARVTKTGASVVASTVEYAAADGRRLGLAHAMFMANPDPAVRMPPGTWALKHLAERTAGVLREPFAERVGCVRQEPGVASIALSRELDNQSRTLNGGVLALLAEEAVLSAEPAGRTLSTLVLRYLRPVRVGPAVARSTGGDGLADIWVTDAGSGSLAMLATARCFGD